MGNRGSVSVSVSVSEEANGTAKLLGDERDISFPY